MSLWEPQWTCPVCGWPHMFDDPSGPSPTSCACCGTVFDDDVRADDVAEIRQAWFDAGMPFDQPTRAFVGWEPLAQLQAASLPLPPAQPVTPRARQPKRWTCPICGWPELHEDPAERLETICVCCRTQFGYAIWDDEFADIRQDWIERGHPFAFEEYRPAGWDALAQLRRAGLAARAPDDDARAR